MNAHACLRVVLKQLPVLAFLRRPILTLPLEEIGAEKAILILSFA